MKITLNGDPRVFPDEVTLEAALREVVGSMRGCAAAVDGEVVPRGEWHSFALLDGQSVEVLTAVQGG